MPVIRENSPCSDDSLIDDVLVNVIMDGTPSSSLNLIDVTYFSNMTLNHILINIMAQSLMYSQSV